MDPFASRAGVPINSNPYKGGHVSVQPVPSDCTLNGGGSQSWNDTHREVNGGRMDGFAEVGVDSLAYWDEPGLPFYYSLAKTFCLANRWFCSAPCQTYPNRRFLQAGTAFGLTSTDTSSVTQYPPNGTIWDRLSSNSVSWADYYTQVPTAAIILPSVEKYPQNMLPIARFYADCGGGTLPAVSVVDSAIGAVDVLAGLAGLSNLPGAPKAAQPSNSNQDEENGNVSQGETFVSHVVNAPLSSPLWPRVPAVVVSSRCRAASPTSSSSSSVGTRCWPARTAQPSEPSSSASSCATTLCARGASRS
jgi:phospholipase C